MNSSTGYILRSSQPTKGLQVLQSHMIFGYNLYKTYDDKRDYSRWSPYIICIAENKSLILFY